MCVSCLLNVNRAVTAAETAATASMTDTPATTLTPQSASKLFLGGKKAWLHKFSDEPNGVTNAAASGAFVFSRSVISLLTSCLLLHCKAVNEVVVDHHASAPQPERETACTEPRMGWKKHRNASMIDVAGTRGGGGGGVSLGGDGDAAASKGEVARVEAESLEMAFSLPLHKRLLRSGVLSDEKVRNALSVCMCVCLNAGLLTTSVHSR